MAKQILAFPEQHLQEVCRVLRAGINIETVSDECREGLESWLLEMEDEIPESVEDEGDPDA
jgi:hypothetical protein